MGGRSCRNRQIHYRPITILILGLDHAGKTTTVKVLEKSSLEYVVPTVGFGQYEVNHSNGKITLYDLGGGESFRESWRNYYADPYGLIYVIDSSMANRLDESREVLQQLLQEEKIQNKPILILANKQDEANALDKTKIIENLQIEQILHDNRTLYRMELCTAKLVAPDGEHSQIDPGIQNGFDWLVNTIHTNYDTLHKRVQDDIRNRKEAEQIAQLERKAALSKIREERAKQEGRKTEEDDHPTTNGFIPIEQAIQNAEKHATLDTDITKTKL